MQSKLFKFLITGGSAALVEYFIFVILTQVIESWAVIYAHIVSFVCGFVVSFTLNRVWVFKSQGSIYEQLLRYLILAIVNLSLSVLLLWVLVDYLEINAFIAKFLTMSAIAVSNYFIFSKIIFKAR